MNKRISTLLVVLLATMSFTTNAQTTISAKDFSPDQSIIKDHYYVFLHLAATNSAMIVQTDPNSGHMTCKAVALSGVSSKVADTVLWSICVSAEKGSNRFVLKNKTTGAILSFDPKTAVAVNNKDLTVPIWTSINTPAAYIMSTDTTKWTWYTAANADYNELNTFTSIKCAFKPDSTMALTTDDAGYIFAYKYANNEIPPINSKFRACVPGKISVTAGDLNVLTKKVGVNTVNYFILATNKTSLIGKESLLNRPFKAVSTIGEGAEAVNATVGYVFLQNVDLTIAKVTDKYAYVDTAFYVGTGENLNRWYKFANGTYTTDLQRQAFEFMITRDLSSDSLIVKIDSTRLTEPLEADPETGITSKRSLHWFDNFVSAPRNTYGTVSVIGLTDNTEILTLYSGCKPENLFFTTPVVIDTTLSTLDKGLYYIKNQKHQYLAVPIYRAASPAVGEYDFVNVENQNVGHMPAYQWIISKNATDSKAKLSITNREFEKTEKLNIQIHKNGSTYYVDPSVFGTDTLVFERITDPKVLGDSLLGYKNMTAFELNTAKYKYTFNYLNPYVADKYIAKDDKDSLVNVLDGKIAFTIMAAGNIEPYGYIVPDGSPIQGLKTLYRQAYTMSVDDMFLQGNRAEDQKYFISEYASDGTLNENEAASTFFFKENNDLGNGKCYYALIDYVPETEASRYSKAGVSDNDLSAYLKKQVYSETRTSAFSIEKDTTPLYRRFNNVNLRNGENAKDSTVVLKFKEIVRLNEYLQDENNDRLLNTAWEKQNNQTIDYAGIWTAEAAKAKGRGLGLTVDTAFIGYGVKPLYLISVARMDQVNSKDTVPCGVKNHQHRDANDQPCDSMHCVYAILPTPSFEYGKYLVSFADSVEARGLNVPFTDVFNGNTRVGFISAIHYNDTLYVLRYALPKETVAAMNIDTFIDKDKSAAMKIILNAIAINNDKKSAAKWAMRYVNATMVSPTTATEGDSNSFLIESVTGPAVASDNGVWMKIQNGCLTLTKDATFSNAKIGGDGALIFNVEKVGADDTMATDAATVTASDFTVIAGHGQITINGAAGKKVVVSNILGQTVASRVLASDNATIPAPAGVVVVAAEGEVPVKAIVK